MIQNKIFTPPFLSFFKVLTSLYCVLFCGVDRHARMDGLGVKASCFFHCHGTRRRDAYLNGVGDVGSLVGVADGGNEVKGAVVVKFRVVVGEAYQSGSVHEFCGYQLIEIRLFEGAAKDCPFALADEQRDLSVSVFVALCVADDWHGVVGDEVVSVCVGFPLHLDAVGNVQFPQVDDAAWSFCRLGDFLNDWLLLFCATADEKAGQGDGFED